jgi:ribosomal protein L30E
MIYSTSAYDAATGRKLENAIVKLRITFGFSRTTKEIMGSNGKVIFSAEVTPNSKNNSNNNYTASVEASVPAYISTTKTTTHSSAHF